MKLVYNGKPDQRMMKDIIGTTITDLLEHDEDVVYLDADLMGCIGTVNLPGITNRAINCGVAEANMIGVACGLSAAGLKPIVHTFCAFASRRCYDQVFLSAGYAGNHITIIGTDPGITAAFNGGTHMSFEDVALFRAIPNAVITDITDIPMLEYTLRLFPSVPVVKYLRVPRRNSFQVYADNSKFEIGKGIVLKEGKDCVIVACGIMVHEALQAAKQLAVEGIEAAVIDPYTIKPLDTELICLYASKTGVVVTAENHNKIGGLYSAVKEVLNGEARVGCVAVDDEFGEVGPQDYLRVRFGLTAERIAQVAKKLIYRV